MKVSRKTKTGAVGDAPKSRKETNSDALTDAELDHASGGSLNFTKVELTYQPQNSDGAPAKPTPGH